MADDRLSAELAAIKARVAAATRGPWWFDEDDLVWRLHGVYTIIPSFAEGVPEQVVNHQILKAPKQGTPYAEYWPNDADAAFIVAARTDVPRLLALAEAVAALCRDTDGNWLDPSSELPVGEFQAAISDALLTGKAAGDAER